MSKVVRVGDIITGICRGHGHDVRTFTGSFNTGSGTCISNGKAIVRVGDTGTTDCNHTFIAVTGSVSSTVDGLAIHRIGDTGTIVEADFGEYTVGNGDPTTDAL